MDIFFKFIYVFLGTLNFAYFLKCPRRTLVAVAFSGAFGFVVTKVFEIYFSLGISASFIGTIALGLSATFFSRKYKVPTTVFFQAGVIPLVPGRAIYEMMYNLVFNNYDKALIYGIQGLSIAALISLGIYITSYISDMAKGAYRKINPNKLN